LWAAASVLFALRSRQRIAWAAAAGAAVGIAVLVRPTRAILAAPLALALSWRPGALALFAAAGAPLAAFQFRWNSAIYGGPLKMGYSGLLDGFAWSNCPERFVHYVRTIAPMFSPLVPAGWLGVGFDRRVPLRDRALLLVWFLAYLLLHCFWGPYEAWWYTRYLLPALPALVVAAVIVSRDLLRLLPEMTAGPLRAPRLALILAVAALLVVEGFERRAIARWKPLDIAEGEKTYPMAMELARSKLSERSLVLSMQMSGALLYYTSFQPVRYDWLAPSDFTLLRGQAESKGYRLYALLVPWEESELTARAPGRWRVIGSVRDVKLWELEGTADP
ncbi:MAG: hypothetical protein ACRD00_04185, partial [Thermoanaerobaculia bacterium]